MSALDSLSALGALLGTLLTSCSPAPPAPSHSTHPIIDGTPAPELTGVVHVRHPLSDLLCSGVVIAPTLVVTAKHCAFRELDPTDAPLPPEGYRIGFGADVEALTLRQVERVAWVGAPDEPGVQRAIDAGEDLVVLVLSEPVPSGTHVHPVALDYVPALNHEYQLVGFGLSSLDTWDSGTKRVTTDAFAGYDAPTGLLQIEGRGACQGDSGGPVLFGDDGTVIGVVSQVGANGANEPCSLGVTFATTVRNTRVRDLLETELDALPPCAERDEICANGQDENCNDAVDEGCSSVGAGGAAGAPSAVLSAGAAGAAATAGAPGSVAGAHTAMGPAGAPTVQHAGAAGALDTHSAADDARGCGCRGTAPGSLPWWWPAALAGALARWRQRQHRKRSARGGPPMHPATRA